MSRSLRPSLILSYNPGDDGPIAAAVIDIVYDPGYDDEPMAEAVIDIVYNRG